MDLDLLLLVMVAAVQAGTPILYATLGEIITERSGILNLGVEGMMIFGAFVSFIILHITGNPWQAFVCGGLAGMFLSSLHGLSCIVFRSNQVVSGLTLTILGLGLANFFGTPYIGTITKGFYPLAISGLASIPVLGPIFFQQDALVYLSYFLVPLCWFFLHRTSLGLSLRAAGENPAALLAAGVSPTFYRWLGTLVGGFLVGLGGSYLSLAYTHQWTHSITAGRGWIAVALVIFAVWRPSRAVLGAYLFGGIWVLQLRLQAVGTVIPPFFLSMLPYALTLVALLMSFMLGGGRSSPAALGVNVEPED